MSQFVITLYRELISQFTIDYTAGGIIQAGELPASLITLSMCEVKIPTSSRP